MTKLLALRGADVEELLPMSACVPLIREALSAFARGEMLQLPKYRFAPPGANGIVQMLPAYRRGDAALFGLKAITIFRENPARGLHAILGTVTLFSGTTGEPIALMDASAITAIRTAAASAVATDLLALPGAGDVAIIGAGVEARAHLGAMAQVRAIRRVRIFNRTESRMRDLVTWATERYPFPVEGMPTVEAALRDADIVVSVTSSREPVIRRPWVAMGAHLNVVGARDVDASTLAVATCVTDRWEEPQGNDASLRAAYDSPSDIHWVEVGEVLLGTHPGRTSASEITVFRPTGLAIEDLAAAERVYLQAVEKGRGTWVEL